MKILGGLVAMLLVLAVGIAIAVALLFDPKEFQPLLAQSVEKATGRKLTLAGDIGLDFFPCCSIRLGHAALGNPPGFADGDFASVENAELSIRLWPLLTAGRVEIGVVSLDGLDARLLVRKDGMANWEFAPQAAATGPAPDATAAPATGLSIGGIRIRDGQIAYRDEQDGSAYRAAQLKLDTGAISPGVPFELRLATQFSEEGDGLGGEIALQAEALLDPATSRLTLNKPLLDFDLVGASLPAKSLKGRLGAATAMLDTRQETRLGLTSLEGELSAPGLKSPAGDLDGSFTAAEASLAIGASSELVIPALKADVTVKGSGIPGGALTGTLGLEGLALDIDKLAGAVEGFKADLDGLGAHLALEGGGRLTPGSQGGAELAGRFKLDPLSPRSLLAVLGEPEPATADPKALTRLAGSGSWSLGKDAVALKDLDIRLDDSQLAGSLGLQDFDKPMTRFDLRVDQLDLDRYLAPAAEAGAKPAKGTAPAGAAAEDIPVETLRGLRLDGRLAIGKLVFARTHLADVGVTVRADGGRLRLDPLAAQLYGGSYRGSVAIDATGPKARVALEQQISALQLGTVLKDRYQTDKLSGALSGRISASGTGNRSDDILATLGGQVALSLADGVFRGTDLWYEIRSARARLRGDAPPPAPASPQTPLEAVEMTGTLVDGVLQSDQLLAQVPFLRLTGKGGLNLVTRSMDYALRAQVFETPTFADGSSISDLKGLAIPLTVKGPFDQPKVAVDVKDMVTGVAAQKLRNRLLKRLGGEDEPAAATPPAEPAAPDSEPAPAATPPKQEEKPRDLLKRGLRDLLKQSQPAPEPAQP